ncbi:unnamed protein product [Linum trigynum]|uniref:Uncharacterized protein n=1 Tax=Linum trigynum TaxID=586398 RepID=A0AAV2GN55_9ROSI
MATPVRGANPSDAGLLDPTAGVRCPPPVTSSPNSKRDRETRQPKKKAKHMRDKPLFGEEDTTTPMYAPMEEADIIPAKATSESVWEGGSRKLFSNLHQNDEWYVAESDSEDVAASMKEDDLDDEVPEDEDQ